ncbi:hypothetical protein C8J57DRAFT_1215780 [Mycena rebaudengoi]|nr:hypothetical protein C8J57DRAFT_1215780 [Mycena rebaudengoi]
MSERSGSGFRFSFFDKQVSTDEEGRVALGAEPVYRDHADGDNSETISLINTEITVRPKRPRKKCCVCCGMNCGLFWKAFGIGIAIFAVWNAYKLIRWAATPRPTGLENMPEFSSSLGCVNAPYIYGATPTSFNVPIGAENSDHGIDIRGGAVGTIIVLEGAPGATTMKYEVVVRADDKTLLDNIIIDHTPEQEAGVQNSHLLITTPHPSEGSCLRYDLKMFVPPNLKKLHLKSHTASHVQFDPESHIQLEDFFVTLFTSSTDNMIIPHNHLQSTKMTLEVFTGWIVGDVAIQSSTNINTQRGSGIMNVRVHPTAPTDPAHPEVAQLRTTSGSGRTDIFYINDQSPVHRRIESVHMSSMNEDMYLTYQKAHYTGLVELASRSYTATGLQSFEDPLVDGDSKWTHWKDNQEGGDTILVKSRGWVGLYF